MKFKIYYINESSKIREREKKVLKTLLNAFSRKDHKEIQSELQRCIYHFLLNRKTEKWENFENLIENLIIKCDDNKITWTIMSEFIQRYLHYVTDYKFKKEKEIEDKLLKISTKDDVIYIVNSYIKKYKKSRWKEAEHIIVQDYISLSEYSYMIHISYKYIQQSVIESNPLLIHAIPHLHKSLKEKYKDLFVSKDLGII